MDGFAFLEGPMTKKLEVKPKSPSAKPKSGLAQERSR